MLKFSILLLSGIATSLSLTAQVKFNDSAAYSNNYDTMANKDISVTSNINSTTTLFSNPNALSASGFYQNSTNHNPLLPGTHHGLLLNMASYWNDNFDAQLYVDYSTPHGETNPHIWYRFSNADGYTSWYHVWANNDDGSGSGLDADLIRGHVPQWTTNGSTIYATNSGNVGIGTTSPQSKLAVNGTITAQKVKVIQTGWPDYVFDSAYSVTSLSSIKAYIKDHHHLPDIPSAEEIQNKGLDIGEMQKRQMQKIEELTLYLIKVNNKQIALEKQVKELKSFNKELVKQIKQLKSM